MVCGGSSPFSITTGFLLAGVGPKGEVKMGFCGHIGTTWVDTPAQYINALTNVGAKILREDVKWGRVEPTLGNYEYPGSTAEHIRLEAALQLAQTQGIEAIAILDYGISLYGPDEPAGYKGGLPLTQEERTGFANYGAYLATTFQGRPIEFEVWNEWNIGLGATTTEKNAGAHLDPVKYHELVVDTYGAVKAANPSAFVWGGVLSDPMGAEEKNQPWFETYTDIPGWADHMDGFSFHHYLIPLVPEYTFWQVRGIAERARKKAGKPNMPVMLSESGWFNGTDQFSVTEDVAADYYSRIPFLLRCTGLNKIVFYALRNDGTSVSKEDNFGVYLNDYTPKQAAGVLADVLPVIHASSEAEYWTDRNRHAVVLDKGEHLALWSSNGSRTISVTVEASAPASITSKIAGGASENIAVSSGTSTFVVTVDIRSKILTLPVGVKFLSIS